MLTDTTRKMASIRTIAKLSPIENSDFLEVAEMENLGWKVVVKKGEFAVGQKIVYFEIDSAINVKDLAEPLKFLAEKGTKKLFTGRTPDTSTFSEEYVRIKTIKLRGQVSQGLIIPIPNGMLDVPNDPAEMNRDWEGEDLTAVFHVEVWDRLVEWFDERSQLGTGARSHAAGSFPSEVPRTDETRLESLMEYFDDPEMVNAEWECSEKNDGSSCTLFYRPSTWPDDPMRIASRRFLLNDDGGSDDWFSAFKVPVTLGTANVGNVQSTLWDVLGTRLYDLWEGLTVGKNGEPIIPPHHELAIQGEMIGPRFNKNRDKNKENHFRVFRIFDITDQKFVTPAVRYAICEYLGLEHVKVLETCKIFQKCKTIDDFEKYVDRKADNGNRIEGVVFKRVDDGSISFKKVSAKYLLNQED